MLLISENLIQQTGNQVKKRGAPITSLRGTAKRPHENAKGAPSTMVLALSNGSHVENWRFSK